MARGPNRKDAADDTACPRCGGPPSPPRKPTVKNPFMTKSKKLVCSLCGLDYERGAAAWAPDASSGPPSRAKKEPV